MPGISGTPRASMAYMLRWNSASQSGEGGACGAGAGGDGLDRAADIVGLELAAAEGQAMAGEVGEDEVAGRTLAVDQHAIAIEDHRLGGHCGPLSRVTMVSPYLRWSS
ncbi:hypothetical protein MASR1M32_11000 [Rhodobacter sp.]